MQLKVAKKLNKLALEIRTTQCNNRVHPRSPGAAARNVWEPLNTLNISCNMASEEFSQAQREEDKDSNILTDSTEILIQNPMDDDIFDYFKAG